MPTGRRDLRREVVLRVERADSPAAQACLERYFEELDARFPSGFEEAGCGSAGVSEFLPPGGSFVVGRLGRSAAACGGIRMLDLGVGEIKRMWVDAAMRGRGVGRSLLQRLEAEARVLGMTVLRLDTSAYLQEAVRLYEAAGYGRMDPYNQNRHASMWFEKRLTAAARR